MINDTQRRQSTCRNDVEKGIWIDYAIGIMSSLPRAEGNTDRTQTDTRVAYHRQTRIVVINIDISRISITPPRGVILDATLAKYVNDLQSSIDRDHRAVVNCRYVEVLKYVSSKSSKQENLPSIFPSSGLFLSLRYLRDCLLDIRLVNVLHSRDSFFISRRSSLHLLLSIFFGSSTDYSCGIKR